MFQNIVDIEKEETSTQEEIKIDKKENAKRIVRKLFTKQNILVYILSFMLSMVNGIDGMAPFGLAIFAAALSNGVPAGIIYVLTLIGTLIGFGRTSCTYIYFNFACIYCYGINYKAMVRRRI